MNGPASPAEALASLKPVLETALDAVVVIDGGGIVLAWSRLAEQVFGWSAAEAVGESLAALIVPPQHRDAHCDGLTHYQRTGEARVLGRRLEITALRKSGEEFPVELSITTADTAAGTLFVGFLRDISERRATEAALRDSETYVRLLLDSSAEGFYAVDRDGVTTLCNPSFVRMLGFAGEAEAIGRKLHDVIHHSHADGSPYPKQACPIYRCAQFGTPAHVNDELFYRVDGVPLPVEYWVHPIVRDGRLEGAVCTFLDITERKDAERAAEAARTRAFAAAAEKAAILTQLAEGVIVADERGRITFVNEAAAQIHGVAELGVAPDDYGQTYHLFTEAGAPFEPDALPLARAVRGETVAETRWRIKRPDGSWVLAIGSARPVLDDQHRQVGALLTVRDDTEREMRERHIRENEARLRALTDHLPGGMVFQLSTGRDGSERRFLYVSQSHEALTGIPAEAVLEDSSIPYRLIHPDDRPMMAEAEAASIRDQAPFDVQIRFRRADGEERWCRIVSAPRAQDDGSLIWDGLQIDVTDRVKAEQDLHALNRSLERRVEERTQERDRLWTLSDDMLARANYLGEMQAVSPAWTRLLGWTEAELLSRPYASFMHPEDVAPTLAALAGMGEKGRPARFENRIATADGAWKWIEWTVVPEPDAPSFVAVGRDLSAAKAREQELAAAREALRQSQKMEAMGQLTGGVAHDFNNLLTPIVGSLDLLQRKRVGDAREQKLIAGAVQSAERAKTLVQRLLAFARRQPLQTGAVDLTKLIAGMTELVSSTTGPQIRVVSETSDDLPMAQADQNQLEMALLNLGVNARDAMPDGGVLRISAETETVPAGHRSKLAPGRYVKLSVSDSGTGMDPATLARAVEPFFSTKGVGKGTGLGLSMVHGLASQLGGALHIESHPGLGTNVELWLPISEAAAEAVESEPKPVADAVDAGLALLVDDEELVRMSTAAMLADFGYRVVEAASAEAALRLIDQGLQPRLLVTDHLMPGMNGTDLAREIRARQPGIEVLVVSGYAESEGIAPDLPRLTKPFRADEMAASLAGLTAAR